ncbi:MAG: ATP-dependent Clp protease adaptor ClpS [Balneolia bacterium]|nr:ATP-dependent Clp protease adaptor ClpS [Balneolia bacterium]
MYDLYSSKRFSHTHHSASGSNLVIKGYNTDITLSADIPGEQPDEFADTLEQTREKIDEPGQYVVYLINDDYTTFEFVVQVLVSIFKKSIEQAVKITNDVHHQGKGACGIYSKQIAETKIALVEDASANAGFPLKCEMEEA